MLVCFLYASLLLCMFAIFYLVCFVCVFAILNLGLYVSCFIFLLFFILAVLYVCCFCMFASLYVRYFVSWFVCLFVSLFHGLSPPVGNIYVCFFLVFIPQMSTMSWQIVGQIVDINHANLHATSNRRYLLFHFRGFASNATRAATLPSRLIIQTSIGLVGQPTNKPVVRSNNQESTRFYSRLSSTVTVERTIMGVLCFPHTPRPLVVLI